MQNTETKVISGEERKTVTVENIEENKDAAAEKGNEYFFGRQDT